MKEKFHIAGIKKILLTWHKHADSLDTPDPARAVRPPSENGGGRERPGPRGLLQAGVSLRGPLAGGPQTARPDRPRTGVPGRRVHF